MPPDINVRSNTPPTLENVCEQALRLPCAPSLLPRLITARRNQVWKLAVENQPWR